MASNTPKADASKVEAPKDAQKPAERPAEPKATEKKGLSDSKRIDAIVELLERNGMSIPKELR